MSHQWALHPPHGLEEDVRLGAAEHLDATQAIKPLRQALGRSVATPTEARAMLGLKGAGEVAF